MSVMIYINSLESVEP